MDPADVARSIIDTNLYMVLGTADEAGRPWVSPVYYAPDQYRDFYWASAPERRHSLNIRARPEISIVIFDSTVPPGTRNGVYMAATGEELGGEELTNGIEVFSRRLVAHGDEAWTVAHVQAPSHLRLYRATATEHYILESDIDRRMAVSI